MKLKRIKDNIKIFLKKFKNYDINKISDESVYSEEYYHKTN